MSRASRRDNSIASSLFPFLAVLLCTMGVLVILLSVMASVQISQAKDKQQAEQGSLSSLAAKNREQYESSEQQALRLRLKAVEENAPKIEQLREQLSSRLSEKQQQLAQIEENVRRRQEKLGLLRRQLAELQALETDTTNDLDAVRSEIERRLALIAATELEIEELKKQAAKGEKNFAIVPYNGANGTRRQPVYIECRRDKVIFQPEGIELTPRDFNAALKSGSPLPSAIRAAQRYYTDNRPPGEALPYPLVIARPDSATTLAIVIGLLEDLRIDFGYEIVEQDWELDYSAADPGLSQEIGNAVKLARLRLLKLQENAPGTFAAKQRYDFDPSPSKIDMVLRSRLPSGAKAVGGGGGSSSGTAPYAGGGTAIDTARLAAAFGGAGSQGAGSSTTMTANSSPTDPPNYPGAGAELPSTSQENGQSLATGALQGTGTGESAVADSTAQPSASGNQEQQQTTSSALAQAIEQASREKALQEGQTGGNSSDSSDNANGTTASANASASASSMGEAPPGYSPKASSNNSTIDGVAVSRTIRVQVLDDRLVVRSAKLSPGATDHTITLDENPNAAAIRFINAIRSEVADWGIAGQGTYWKPVLQISVTPGGRILADRIAAALRQSGMEVRMAMLQPPRKAN